MPGPAFGVRSIPVLQERLWAVRRMPQQSCSLIEEQGDKPGLGDVNEPPIGQFESGDDGECHKREGHKGLSQGATHAPRGVQ